MSWDVGHAAASAPTVHMVLPAGVDDPAAPSGGNVYDRRVCQELPSAGWSVHEVPVRGRWPRAGTAAGAELAEALAKLPDGAVVLMDGLVACGVPEIVVPQVRRLRLAVLVHLPLADETGLAPGVAAELERREGETLRAASAVVATSPWAARQLTDRHWLDPNRVYYAAPGIDPAPPARGSHGTPQLLCVAALIPRKGQDLLVDALAAVAGLPWRCELVGAGDRDPVYTGRLRERIGELGLTGRVRLGGVRTGERLAGSYAAADLLVLPSRAETYGMVVTEALARAVPVLASAVDAVPDTLGRACDGSVPGLLVPPQDARALATALRRWLTDPVLRRQLAASALRRRTALDGWQGTSRRLAEVLSRLGREPRRA
ncbi:glycosyltransferase family 4 protein [Streptomyces yunnanensis]|uniref:D-inositol 3-phosphate glycosyltransferase n=1 Tax=Streptomyces yunnanensis TaxID=156453 RepID=A0ABY8AKE2_9ACTN|nr:glycosyltransferase family 4 protein [Streptomyces yunnanensis]WEB45500.1 glycosyltransferase family 4 protein [Streptomyces yunnanensis]